MNAELLNDTINALEWIIQEANTNFAFADEDDGEREALENAENVLVKLVEYQLSLQ